MSLKMSLNTSNQYCCMFESSHPNQLSKDSKDSVPKRNHLQPGGGPLQQNTAVTFRGKQSTVYNPFDHLESDMNSQYYVHASKESNLGFPNSRSGSAEGQLTHASGAEPTASATLSQPGQYHSLKVGKPASVHNQANFNLKNMRHRDRANVDTSMNDPTNSSMENHSNSSPKFVASTFLYNPNQQSLLQTSGDQIDEGDFDEFGPARRLKVQQQLSVESTNQNVSQMSGTALQQISLSTRKKQIAMNHLQNESLTFT